jgi:Secretion system C-terminal sorting domain
MKKLFIIVTLLTTIMLTAQRVGPSITGPCSIIAGQQVTYTLTPSTVGAAVGQCLDCYDWDINNTNLTTSGNVEIIGSDQNQSVVIKGITAGSFSLKATYFDEAGCNVVTYLCGSTNPVVVVDPCTIVIPSFTFSTNPITNIITLSTAIQNGVIDYVWQITYTNNYVVTLYGANPIPVSNCNNGSPIKSIYLLLKTGGCRKEKTVIYNNFSCPLPQQARAIKITNPIKNILNIEKSNLDVFEGKIYDLNGNQVGSFNEKDYLSKDFSSLKNNLYLVKISDAEGIEILSQKIIKE